MVGGWGCDVDVGVGLVLDLRNLHSSFVTNRHVFQRQLHVVRHEHGSFAP